MKKSVHSANSANFLMNYLRKETRFYLFLSPQYLAQGLALGGGQ